jgi:23S rRNA-/tRNA-specific pseudouridylate synthase
VTFDVDVDDDGSRLDRFLVSVLPEHSRSQIQRLIKEGQVQFAGR